MTEVSTKNNIIATSVLWIAAFVLCVLNFEPFITHPNSMLINMGGDGIKNYFTYWFYILNDSGSRFTGMNYPFGEHIIFTDNMPILSQSIKKLSTLFPGIDRYAIGIMHTSMMIGQLLGVYFIYKIILRFKVPLFWAIISALFIAFFSPQTFKMYGHFGMGYTFMLPCIIYLTMQYEERQKWYYLLGIYAVLQVVTFLHLYNFVIVALLLLSYVGAFALLHYKQHKKGYIIKRLLPLVAIVAIVYGILSVYLSNTDYIADRPTYPYGLFNGASEGKDLFVSATYLGGVLSFIFGKEVLIAGTEGYVYLGLVTIGVAIYFIIRVFKKLLSKKHKGLANWHVVPEFNVWLIVAFLSLLIGMGVPLVWFKEFFAEHIATLRQFRTIGRFSWIFYYLFMIYSSIAIYRWASFYLNDKKLIYHSILTTVVVVWVAQSWGYTEYRRKTDAQLNVESHSWYTDADNSLQKILKEYQVDTSRFQAIHALPYFHVGSEKLWLFQEHDPNIMTKASKLSILTGLPMTNVLMSRSSWSQTFQSINLVDGSFGTKPILDAFNDKAILLLMSTQAPIASKEREWLQNAKPIASFKEDGFDLYEIDVPSFKKTTANYRHQTIERIVADTRTYGLLDDDTTTFYYKADFENHGNTNVAFLSKRAWTGSDATFGIDTLVSLKIPEVKDTGAYVFSIWAKVSDDDYSHPIFDLQCFNAEGQMLSQLTVRNWCVSRVIDYWLLYDADCIIPATTTKILVVVKGSVKKKSYIALDRLMFYPQGGILFDKTPQALFINNRPQE